MNDIVERLRGLATRETMNVPLCGEAADEIERLRALLDAARICLKNRDQSEREAAVYAAIRRALDGYS